MSLASYGPVDPTNLGNFVSPLRLPGEDGILGLLDAPSEPVWVTARRENVAVLPGKETEVLVYRAELDGRVFSNPVFVVEKGASFSADFVNRLEEETTIHWHGLHLDWRADGHPSRPVVPGATHRYAFPVLNRGGTY